jgi:predicted Zn-dependent protease
MLHAELLLRTGRPADAEAAVRRAMAELPEDADGHDRLSRLLQASREGQAAQDG